MKYVNLEKSPSLVSSTWHLIILICFSKRAEITCDVLCRSFLRFKPTMEDFPALSKNPMSPESMSKKISSSLHVLGRWQSCRSSLHVYASKSDTGIAYVWRLGLLARKSTWTLLLLRLFFFLTTKLFVCSYQKTLPRWRACFCVSKIKVMTDYVLAFALSNHANHARTSRSPPSSIHLSESFLSKMNAPGLMFSPFFFFQITANRPTWEEFLRTVPQISLCWSIWGHGLRSKNIYSREVLGYSPSSNHYFPFDLVKKHTRKSTCAKDRTLWQWRLICSLSFFQLRMITVSWGVSLSTTH